MRTVTTVSGASKPSALPVWSVLEPLLIDHPELRTRQTLELLYPIGLETKTSQFKIFDLIESASHAGGRDPYLVTALVHLESAFDPAAGSGAGATGLGQVELSTAQKFEPGLSEGDLLDPKINLRLTIKILNELFEIYNGNLPLSLAAYNAGPPLVTDWAHNGIYASADPLIQTDLLLVNAENDYHTSHYVSTIQATYEWYKLLYP